MNQNVYQPFLDYGLVPNPAIIFPTVIDNFDWSIFKPIATKYYKNLSDFLRLPNSIAGGKDSDMQMGFPQMEGPVTF